MGPSQASYLLFYFVFLCFFGLCFRTNGALLWLRRVLFKPNGPLPNPDLYSKSLLVSEGSMKISSLRRQYRQKGSNPHLNYRVLYKIRKGD